MKDLPEDYSSNLEDKRKTTADLYAMRQALLAHASGSTAYGPANRTTAFGGSDYGQGATPVSDPSSEPTPMSDQGRRTPRSVTDLGGNTPQ